MAVPVSIVTGPLGVGKTTAILDALARRPEGERWAVLVNEFGEVGIDGPVFEAAGVSVREVAGGCICCTAGLELSVGIVRLLRDIRPDRLLIEPSGAARPSAVIDALRAPGVAPAVVRKAVITLVDPVRFLSGEPSPTVADQVAQADILVGTRADRASPAQLEAFLEAGRALLPPKQVVATVAWGRLEPAWLDLDPGPDARRWLSAVHTPEFEGQGWVWPADAIFERHELEDALQAVVVPHGLLPAGAARLKGLLRTPRATLEVQGTPDSLTYRASDWRRDSRIEILTAAGTAPDWDAVLRRLEQALRGAR